MLGDTVNKLVIIDTETGGLDSSRHSILSLAAVVLHQHKLIDQIELFIKEPVIYADPEALEVNKINLGWLRANGMTPLQAVLALDTFLIKHFQFTKAHWGGQNVCFDKGFLERLYRLAAEEYPTHKHLDFEHRFHYRTTDTMYILRFLGEAGVLPFTSGALGDAVEYFGIDTRGDTPHNALGDARTAAKVLSALYRGTSFAIKGKSNGSEM